MSVYVNLTRGSDQCLSALCPTCVCPWTASPTAPAGDAEGPPPTPDVDYEAADLAAVLTPEQIRSREEQAAVAAAALKDMGLDVSKPRRKTKKVGCLSCAC